MSRKDYELIASVIRTTGSSRREPDALTMAMLVDGFCQRLAQDNPRFDPDKFKEACRG